MATASSRVSTRPATWGGPDGRVGAGWAAAGPSMKDARSAALRVAPTTSRMLMRTLIFRQDIIRAPVICRGDLLAIPTHHPRCTPGPDASAVQGLRLPPVVSL